MKTPKRSYDPNLNHLIRAHYTDKGKERRSRWKRKNREAQYKRTIARQKKEYERLWESFSHMSKRCCQLLYPNNSQP